MARSFTVVGPGRAGTAFAIALTDLGWTQTASYGRGDDIARAAGGVDICVIATPDSAIASEAESIERSDAVIVHLSGAAPVSVLGDHRAGAIHPLVSLADPVSGAAKLRTAWFAVAGDRAAVELAEELSGRWFEIADEDRALYHATAAVASNHLVALLGHVERMAEEVSVPLDAFMNLVRGTVENVAELGPAAALTGPAARGDEATITAHLLALSQRLPDEVGTYEAMLAEARRLAASRPRPD